MGAHAGARPCRSPWNTCQRIRSRYIHRMIRHWIEAIREARSVLGTRTAPPNAGSNWRFVCDWVAQNGNGNFDGHAETLDRIKEAHASAINHTMGNQLKYVGMALGGRP